MLPPALKLAQCTPQESAPATFALNRLRISPEARRYAVQELVRRSGVARDIFRQWTVDVLPDRTTLSLGPFSGHKIHFLYSPGGIPPLGNTTAIPVARAAWLHPPGTEMADSHLILPFCSQDQPVDAPLYRRSANGDVLCDLDLLSSILLTLSRAEETSGGGCDQHGRYLASASIASEHGFLERPILDEHGLAFEQVILSLWPGWQPRPRLLRLKLSHDIDQVGLPFQLHASVGHALKRRSVSAALRDFASLAGAAEPAELHLVRLLAEISARRGLHSAFYWKSSQTSPWDTGYDPMNPNVQSVIRTLREMGFELGVHPAYATFGNRANLLAEVGRLNKALALRSAGGRQHYLRWAPGSWLDWEAAGLSYDSSVGYAEQMGFRAGTAYPYRPWSIEQNRELNLVEVPLLLMDVTPVRYLKLPRAEGLRRIHNLVGRTARVGGVFTLLWHNTSLLEPDFKGWYEAILEMLASAQQVEIPARADLLW